MDPLFGFVDDLAEQSQRQQQQQGTADYNIYSSQNAQMQQNATVNTTAAQFSSGALAGHVVRLVPDAPQRNADGVYVIKLENVLQECSSGDNEGPSNFLGGEDQREEREEGENENGGSSDCSSSESEGLDEEEERQEKEADPFLVISPEAVVVMAQSVGVDLKEEAATELGCNATTRLRNAILIALQFSQNENSEGICVEHFSKAEKHLNSKGYGHESVYRETAFKYAGGVSILDDGPEIDLYATIRQTNLSEITVEDTEPVLYVHHLRSQDSKSEQNNSSENFKLYDEPVVLGYENDLESEIEEEDNTHDHNQSNTLKPPESPTLAQPNNTPSGDNTLSSTDDSFDDLNKESEVEALVQELANVLEYKIETPIEVNKNKTGNVGRNTDENESQGSDDHECEDLAPEWVSFLQLLIEEIVVHNYNEEFNSGTTSDFETILSDIRHNGVHPIFHIICDTFRDYLRNPKISKSTLLNIISAVDALVTSHCQPTLIQMTDVASVLIEIIILPPPCDVHRLLTNVFVKILGNCNELLTWTCTYVTEMLKGISELPLEQLHEPSKSIMHGALCLVNGLEELRIQVAQEFDWHNSVLNFCSKHSNVFDGQAYRPTMQDSFLEEEILRFCHNFLNNYTGLVSSLELSTFRETVTSLYGERFSTSSASFCAPIAHLTRNRSSRVSTKNPQKKLKYVYRKVMYKDKEITIPYVKSKKT